MEEQTFGANMESIGDEYIRQSKEQVRKTIIEQGMKIKMD